MRKAERQERAERRAFELAATGDYPSYVEIEHQLEAEGVSEARGWLDSPGLRARLRAVIGQAHGKSDA